MVRSLLDEVFGSENVISLIAFAPSGGRASLRAAASHVKLSAVGTRRTRAREFRRDCFRRRSEEELAPARFLGQLTGRTCCRTTDDENRDPSSLPIGSRICIPSDLTLSHEYIRDEFVFHGRSFSPGRRYWSTSIESMSRLVCRPASRSKMTHYGSNDTSSIFRTASMKNSWTGYGGPRVLRSGRFMWFRPTRARSNAASLAKDRFSDPVLRPNLRLGDDGVCRRAVGAALDHHRHEPRRAGARAHAADGREVSVLPARRLAGRRQERSRGHRQDSAGVQDRERHQERLRLQARAARHAEVDREQPGHQGRDDARGDRRRHPAPRRHRAALRQAVRGQQAHPRVRAVHRREPLAAPRPRDRRRAAARRRRKASATRPSSSSR